MARKQSEELAEWWREVVRRQVESGRSVRGFCASAGISEPSFYAWRKKLRERSDNGSESPRNARRRERTTDKAPPRLGGPKPSSGNARSKPKRHEQSSDNIPRKVRAPRNEKRREPAPNHGSLFVPIKLLDTPAALKIVHPLGCQIEVSGEVNPVALRQVLDALDQRSAP